MAELLAELVAKISADATELKKALAESEKGVEGLGKTTEKGTRDIAKAFQTMGKSMVVVGASITAAMGLAIKSFTDTGSELHDLSLKTGVSVKALAGLKYAAEQNGASLGTVEMALKKMGMELDNAKDGMAESTRGLNKLGLSLTDLQGLNPEEQFLKIASAIADLPTGFTKTGLAVQFFGRSGTDMLPMLSEGADGLRKMMEEGVKLTGWTDEGTKSADALGDAFSTLKTSTMGVFNAIGDQLAPTLKDLADKVTGLISKFTDWSKTHPELVKGVGLLGGGLGITLTAVGGLILALPALISSYKALGIVAAAAQLSTIGLLGSIMGLIAGIGMLTFGILYISNQQASYDKIKLEGMRLDVQREKYLKGEVNTYKELLAAYIPMVEAYVQIANLKDEDAEAQRRWIAQAKEGLKLLEKTTTTVEKVAIAYDPGLVKAQDRAAESAKNLADREGKLNEQFADLMRQLQFNETGSAKLGLTMDDVYTAMYKLGYKTEEVRKVFERYGNVTEIDEMLLSELGLTAEQVARVIGKLSDKTKEATQNQNDFTKSLQKTTEIAKTTEDAITSLIQKGLGSYAAISGLTGGAKEGAISDYQQAKLEVTKAILAENPGMRSEYASVLAATATNPFYAAVTGGQTYFPEYQKGGIVENTGLAYLHEGETVTPANETMGGDIHVHIEGVNFFDREETMNRFVDMISKGIDRKQRLKFGGAYNG